MAHHLLPATNPLGLRHLMLAIQDNSLRMSLLAICFWRLAKWGSSDSRELLKRIGV